MSDTAVTKDIVRQLVPFLSRKGIPITPENYRIWFEYFLGRKEEIKKHLDELLAADTVFSLELNEKLYEKFFVRTLGPETTEKVQAEIEAADTLSRKVSEMVINIMKDVLAGSESSSGYGKKLQQYMGIMESSSGLADVQTLLSKILKDTNETTSQTLKMQKKLEHSSEELEVLHAELVNAKNDARTDNLTRLWNRRFFDESMVETLKQAKQGKRCSLLMLDIDHFKRFNDEFGHLIGDKLLKHVSKSLRNIATGDARVCRYGGEEFAIIHLSADLQQATALAERIRKEIEEVSFTVKGKDVDVTISIGVSQARADDSVQTFIERADSALYAAKRSGRNAVKTEKDIQVSAQDNKD